MDLVVAQGASALLSLDVKTIDGARFTVKGLADWWGGEITMKNNGEIIIDGALFMCRTSDSMIGDNTNCKIIVKNSGLLMKDTTVAPLPTLIQNITISLLTGGVFVEEGFNYRPPNP